MMRPAAALSLALAALAPCVPCISGESLDTARFSDPRARLDRVLQLADARLSLMPAVAAWKWRHHAPISDPPRERAVILAAARIAGSLGLAPQPVARLFALEVRLARDEEAARYAAWRRGGYDFPGRVPDLEKELRPQLDRLTHELLDALYVAAPTLAAPDFVARHARQAAQVLVSAGWSAGSRRELLEDLGQMHLASTPALQRIAASHVLRIGTTGDYAPFSVESRGTLCGADIELALDLARQLGSRPLFVRTSWPTLLSDLRRDEFDVAIGGISATAARGAVAGLTIPYLSVGKTIITRCAVARRLGSLAALDQPGVRVVVNPGGTNEQFARSHLHRAQLRLYKDNLSIFDELIAGRADAMITDDVEVELETHRHRELCRSFPGTLTRADKVILTARDAALTAAVNAWLGKELAAGVVDRLLREGAGTCDAEATAAGRAAR